MEEKVTLKEFLVTMGFAVMFSLVLAVVFIYLLPGVVMITRS